MVTAASKDSSVQGSLVSCNSAGIMMIMMIMLIIMLIIMMMMNTQTEEIATDIINRLLVTIFIN